MGRPARSEEDTSTFIFHRGRIATGNAVAQDGKRPTRFEIRLSKGEDKTWIRVVSRGNGTMDSLVRQTYVSRENARMKLG